MRKLYLFLLLILLFTSCSKTVPTNPGTTAFFINGLRFTTLVSNSIQFNYKSNKLYETDFAFLDNNIRLAFFLGNSSSTFKGLYKTDSLVKGNTYTVNSPLNSDGFLYNGVEDYDSRLTTFTISVKITRYAGNYCDGTFSGKVIGISNTTGKLVTDVITNGSFANIPIQRVFE
jgi:hypothetical protein